MVGWSSTSDHAAPRAQVDDGSTVGLDVDRCGGLHAYSDNRSRRLPASPVPSTPSEVGGKF
jgi:hypothetical protein